MVVAEQPLNQFNAAGHHQNTHNNEEYARNRVDGCFMPFNEADYAADPFKNEGGQEKRQAEAERKDRHVHHTG